MTDTEVAIIGAGPTGLMLANLLGLYGVPTKIFEKRQEPFSEPRAIAYDPETLRLFQTIGCYETLLATLQMDVPVKYLNANGKTLAHIYDCPPAFGHSGRGTYYQPELEQALVEGLRKYSNVELLRGANVNGVEDRGREAALTIQTDTNTTRDVIARYVVDCSGGASAIRKQLGIEFVGTTFKEKWLVIDVENDGYDGCEIKFFCDPKRPAVTLPVSKNRRRWEFLVMPGDNEAELVSEERSRSLMATYGADKTERIERSLVYTFHARFADKFSVGRIFLAGDAAHVMPPFAGQGLNSGMRDAANIAWKLAGVLNGKFNEEILESYDPERRPHVEDMTKLTVQLGRSIMPTSEIRAWLRDRLMLTAWRFRSTREKFNRGDMIPKPSIKGSNLVNWSRSKKVGQMLEQPTIECKGQQIKLDDRLGGGFSVIGLNCRPEEVLCDRDKDLLNQLDAAPVSIASEPHEAFECSDPQRTLSNLVETDEAILIVRPDRFVVDAFTPTPNKAQLDWMRASFAVPDAS